MFETFAWSAHTLELIGLGALSALFIASGLLNVWFLRRMRGLDARQQDLMQRIRERTDRRDLATVAVAAVVLTQENKQLGRKELKDHIDDLLQHWTQIEEMADEVSRKLDDVVSADGRR